MKGSIYYLIDSIISIAAGCYLLFKPEIISKNLKISNNNLLSMVIRILGLITFIYGIMSLLTAYK